MSFIAMKIYFDESGQTGCVLLKNNMLNFDNQPVFALGAVIVKEDKDETLLLDKYKKFKEIYPAVKELYKKSSRTIYRYKEKGKNIVLYPRLEPEEQKALEVFMTQYNKFFTKNYQNIFRIEGRK